MQNTGDFHLGWLAWRWDITMTLVDERPAFQDVAARILSSFPMRIGFTRRQEPVSGVSEMDYAESR